MKHPFLRLFRRRSHSLLTKSLFFILSSAFLSIFLIGNALLTPPQIPSIPQGSNEKEADASVSLPVLSRNEGIYTCLILGKDTVGDNTDVMMLTSFRVKEGKVSVLQIPRDTYFRYQDKGIKLGTLYSRLQSAAAKRGDASPKHSALKALCDTLTKHLAVPIDYYLLVDLQAVAGAVDAMGGVEIDVPCDMDYEDPAQDLFIHLRQGKQTLNGEKALQFLRFRSGYITADIGRLDAQKLFVSALLQKLKEPGAMLGLIGQVPNLLGRVSTNADLSSSLYFLGKIGTLDAKSISLSTAAGESIQGKNGAWYYILNRESMLRALNDGVNPYQAPIPEETFDALGAFYDESDPRIDEIYRRPMHQPQDHSKTAAELIENGVHIPLLKANR